MTPYNKITLLELSKIKSDIRIITPPQDALTIIISLLVSVAVTLAITPKVPNAANRNIPEASPNNGLSSRTNEVRIGARRPSIWGTVNAVPDLLVLPYKIYNKSGKEIEYNYMFVSEGTVTGSIFKEGSTQLKHISGSSLELYYPNNSPLQGSPEIVVGGNITEPLISPTKNASVNGQTLRPPNKLTTRDQIRTEMPNRIIFKNSDDLLDKYEVGEKFLLTDSFEGGNYFSAVGVIQGETIRFGNRTLASMPSYFVVGNEIHAPNQDHSLVTITAIVEGSTTTSHPAPDPDVVVPHIIISVSPSLEPYTPPPILSGPGYFTQTQTPADLRLYVGSNLLDLGSGSEILEVHENEILLSDPPVGFSNTAYKSRSFSVEGPRWTDYFVLEARKDGIIANLTAPNGMFKDNGETQYRSTVSCVLGITPIDMDDNPIGAETYETVTMEGSASVRDSVNKTLRFHKSGRCMVRMHRSSLKDKDFSGQVVDDVKWKDLYSFENITDHDINNTRIRTATVATEGALNLKERKLTISDATRCLPKYIDGEFTTELYPTKSADDILIGITLDPLIGRRQINEINQEQIYQIVNEIRDYFGETTAADFSYTFDSSDLSFEDSFAMVSNAIFCKAYRRGRKLNLSFERARNTSTLLFNHKNKIPGSEKRRIQFGVQNDADGSIAKWIDSNGTERTVSVPSSNLRQPIETSILGLNEFQANKHAWRSWNKARYQNLFTEFDATSEASLSVLQDRILVANNTTSKTFDGDVRSQRGTELILSSDVPDSGTIHLQLDTAETVPINYTRIGVRKIELISPPPRILSTNVENYARATYLIGEASTDEDAFLLLEKTGDSIFNMKLGNYDSRFYQEDQT